MTREELILTFIDPALLYDLMSVPSASRHESMMRKYLMDYAAKNNIQACMDEMGNVYLQKGTCREGEFFPCFTAHMDTVQLDQLPFIENGERLALKTGTYKELHTIYTEDFGLGGDDKAGILIALTILSRLEKAKAVFFVREEIGCEGSDSLDENWFEDVGYVIAFDSPGLWRASYSCWGIKLFDEKFFCTYLEPLANSFGRIKYFADPYTDVRNIRERTGLACMNMGAGYYDYHSSREYCIVEHMDQACEIGLSLEESLGLKRYIIPLEFETEDFHEYINRYNNKK